MNIHRKVSVWLLPPEANNLRNNLQYSIDTIASRISGPSFVPHVTILGGINCPTEETASDQWANDLLKQLRSTLPCVGGIPCHFLGGERPIVMKENGSVTWNQSCISVMEQNDQFRKAVVLTHAALSKVNGRLEGSTPLQNVDYDAIEEEFDWKTALKPPICEPHYSHAYGNGPDLIDMRIGADENSPFLVQKPPDFVSKEAMLVWTYPANVEGVLAWKEVGRLKLVF